MAIRFLLNTSTDPLENQLDLGGLNASRGRFVWSFVKYVDDIEKTE